MFSGDGSGHPQEIKHLPDIFRPLVQFLNAQAQAAKKPLFNQFVVNWYETKHDYTPFHVDCLTGMVPEAEIAIISLVEDSPGALRDLVFKPKWKSKPEQYLHIPQEHGLITTISGKGLTAWRHGLLRSPAEKVKRRISLSCRSYYPRVGSVSQSTA